MREACHGDSVKWYAVSVRARCEALTARALEDRDFETYSPMLRERRRYSDRFKVCEVAAFPGYIFCHFNLRDKVKLLAIPGVHEIVTSGGDPAAISDKEIDAVRRMLNLGAHTVPYFTCGQRVKIEYGALAGIEGILTRANSMHELSVSIKLLQRSVSLGISPDQVSIVNVA